MKNLILLTFFALSLSCCKKDDENLTPLEQLPPATQTGEQTFGCLISGEAFIPDKFGSGTPRAFYQLVNGKYTFVVSSSKGGGELLTAIGIGGIEINPLKEDNFDLTEEKLGNTFGKIITGIDNYTTSSNNPGSLNITRFDNESFIMSGTFEFTVKDNDNNEIKITDGRFDLKYTN